MIPILTSVVASFARLSSTEGLVLPKERSQNPEAWAILLMSGFLVSVPVFLQAPLVRSFPWLSLFLTGGWIILAISLMRNSNPKIAVWGDLFLGFSWSWLAGSIYWGWFRWEPLIHLPIEAIALPVAIWALSRRWGMVGNLFYLGSLTGTAITDIYFYLTGLIDYWRQLMAADPSMAAAILHSALVQIQSNWGIGWAVVLVSLLLGLGKWALKKPELHWWAFAGAVLSTILVDSLFWIAAILA